MGEPKYSSGAARDQFNPAVERKPLIEYAIRKKQCRSVLNATRAIGDQCEVFFSGIFLPLQVERTMIGADALYSTVFGSLLVESRAQGGAHHEFCRLLKRLVVNRITKQQVLGTGFGKNGDSVFLCPGNEINRSSC